MTAFRCIAMATETAERFRHTGLDDSENTLRRVEASDAGRLPCRHCLRFATAGETMLLGSYDLPGPRGIYWTPSPIFVHARSCNRYVACNEVAPIAGQDVLVSVRAYDQADQCIYDLGQVALGAAVDAPLARALDDPRTAFVNVHTAKPGCWLFRVERTA